MNLPPSMRIPLKRGPKPHSSFIDDSPISSDDPPDFESHVVLRVPEDCVNRIQKIIGNESGKSEDLAINLNADARTATLRIGNQLLNGKVLDLPTITEVHKTLDNKNLFKVADVSQIVVCTHDTIGSAPFAPTDAPNDEEKAAKKAAKQWQYPHGLTPPLKCARKKRFRKTKKKKFMDAPEVEKELKRLLRQDLEADTVSWQIVDGNKNKDAAVGDERSQRSHVRYSSSSEEESDVQDEEKDEL